MLPTNLGETMRTVQDKAFFELRPLKHKVQAIGTTVHVIWKLTLPRHLTVSQASSIFPRASCTLNTAGLRD